MKPLEIPVNWNETEYLNWYELCENYEETFEENDGLFFVVDKAPKAPKAPKQSAYLDYWRYQALLSAQAPKQTIKLKPKSAFNWRSDEIKRLKAFLDEDEIRALFTDIRIAWLKAPKRPTLEAPKQLSAQAPTKAPKNFMHTYKVWSAHIKRLKKRLIQIRSASYPIERFIPSNLYQAPKRLISDSRALQKSAQDFVELFRQFRISNFNTGLGSAHKSSRSSNISLEDNVKSALERYKALTDFRSAQALDNKSFEDIAKAYRKAQAPKRPSGKDYQVFFQDVWTNQAPKFQEKPIVEALKTVLLPKSSLPEMKFWDSETQTFIDRRDILAQTSRDILPVKTWVKTFMLYCGSAQYQQIDVFSYSGKTCLRTYIKQSGIKSDSLLWAPRNESNYQTDQAPLHYGLCNYWFGALEAKAPKAKAPKRQKPKNVSKKQLSKHSKSKMK